VNEEALAHCGAVAPKQTDSRWFQGSVKAVTCCEKSRGITVFVGPYASHTIATW